MIELKYTFATSAELLAHLTALGTAPATGSAKDLVKATKADPPKAEVKSRTAETNLTATQVAAVDDTAGLEQKPKAEPKPEQPAVKYPELRAKVMELAGLVTQKGLDVEQYVKSIARGLGSADGTMKPFEQQPDKIAEAYPLVLAQIDKVKALEVEVA